FLVPGGVLKQVDNRVGIALLVWLAGGVLSLLGALTYGELSASHPKAGGLYIYIRDCFGPLSSFLFGWALFFAIGSGAVATLAAAFSKYLGEVITLSPLGGKLVSVGMIALVAAVNVWGTRKSSDVTNWATAIKVGALLVMSGALLWFGHGLTEARQSLWPERFDSSVASNFGLAMVSVLWAYEGWQFATFSAGETVNPQRNFPRAFFMGTAALIAIYLLANVAYLAALGPAGVSGSSSVAAASLRAAVNPQGAKLIAIAIGISIFSAANSVTLTSPRVYYAMANDGVFFKQLAEVHPRLRTPAVAIIASSIWAAVLSMLGTFSELLTYVVFTGWVFYGLAGASIFIYRKREPSGFPGYRVPGYPITPLLFILAASAVVINTLVANLQQSPKKTAMALGVILLGVPVYFVWRSRHAAPLEPAPNPEGD
ncbi:MAG TPA: amino acid permease, partial [Blastocatellia bacterium]|nr:amino acid permease [Blastocatellia bacterium]